MKPLFTKLLNTIPVQLIAVVVMSTAIVTLLTLGMYRLFRAIVQPSRS
jgi:hypothetical protein